MKIQITLKQLEPVFDGPSYNPKCFEINLSFEQVMEIVRVHKKLEIINNTFEGMADKIPKPTKRLAPALIRIYTHYRFSKDLYSSEEEAKAFNGDQLVSWPAPKPDELGFITVEG